MSSSKSSKISKSFRFSPEAVELIESGAASHRCKQVQYLEFLLRQEKAKNEKEAKLISYALARQNSKLEKLEYAVEDLGAMLMDFIILFYHDKDIPGVGHQFVKKFRDIHLHEISKGNMGFIQRLYNITDEDINWEQIQARAQELCSQSKSTQGNGGVQ